MKVAQMNLPAVKAALDANGIEYAGVTKLADLRTLLSDNVGDDYEEAAATGSTTNVAALVAAATGLAAADIKPDAFLTSVKGLDSKGLADSNKALSEWVGGLPLSNAPYSDVFTPEGGLKIFMNQAGDKVSGRMVRGKDGKESKLYKRFAQLAIEAGAEGIEVVTIDGTEYPLFVSAVFGIIASDDTSRAKESYQGGEPRYPRKHDAVLA